MAATQVRPRVIASAVAAWRDAFAAISAMPVVIGVAAVAILLLLAISSAFVPRRMDQVGLGSELLAFLVGMAQSFLLTPAAIAVHRFVLLGERSENYRLEPHNPRFRRYLVFAIIVQLAIAVPGALVGIADDPSGLAPTVVDFVGLMLFIFAVSVLLRTLILFAAIAVDAPGANWSNAMLDSKGHTWRLLLIVIAVALPAVAAYVVVLVALGLPEAPSGGALAVLVVLEAGVTVLTTTAYVALASRLFAAWGDRLAGTSSEAPAGPAG